MDEGEAVATSSSTTPETTSAAKDITYDDKGDAIYTDEATKYRYKWCKVKSQWKAFENEHYTWNEETEKWIPKVATENEFYRWCETTNQWIPKMSKDSSGNDVVYSYDEKSGCHTYTDKDGCVFLFDKEKKAWFPKVDDDFLAVYQLNYGFVDNKIDAGEATKQPQNDEILSDTAEVDKPETSVVIGDDGKKRKATQAPPKWFEVSADQNTKVYVSNLPLDITEEEFAETMSKCGMIMKDIKTGKLKIKLYRDSNKELKGDALCHYIRVESVDLALNVLDGYDVRGNKIKVQRAQFQMKGDYNPALKPKVRKAEKQKIKKMQEKLFDWRPDKLRGERAKHERTVIIKNLFSPELFDKEVHLILDYQNDLRDEAAKCGTVRKVVIYDRHPEGVGQITMGDPEEADLVIKMMNGRMFTGRKLIAETWDGKAKFKVDESEIDKNERLAKWENYLKDGEEGKQVSSTEQKSTDAPDAEVEVTSN